MSPANFHHHQLSIRNMREINGPRPSPLKISKDSHLIHKLSSSSNSLSLAHNKQHQQQPVIIYAHSPKVIHTQPRDFMALVQKLTGLSGSADHETAPTTKARKTNKHTMKKMKQKQKTSRDERGKDSASALSGVKSSSIRKAPTNPFLADMPLFTPTSTDFFCSPRPMFRFPETMFASPISSSLIEFIKGYPEC